jgi:hypothetical protein
VAIQFPFLRQRAVPARPARQPADGGYPPCAARTVLTVAALLWAALVAAQPAGLPAIQLSAPLDASGTGVRFESSAPTEGVVEPALEGGDDIAKGLFEYRVDTSQIRWGVDCGCYRNYVIVLRARSTGTVTRHKFRAYPSGSFLDRFADVKMDIRYGPADGDVASAQISLPIASAPGLEPTPLLTVGPITEPVRMTLGGSEPIELAVKNILSRMPVLLTTDIPVRPATAKLWKNWKDLRAESPGGRVPSTLAPGAVQTLTITAEPNLWQVLQASLDPTKSDKPHTELRFELPYANPTFLGRDLAVSVVVPILFRPSAIALFFALLGGVLLGSLVRLLTSWRSPIGRWVRATLTALAVGVILEVIGALMVYNNSKFVVFGFNLDPFQTLPVLALGICTGLLGFEAAKKLNFIRDPTQGDGK